MHTRSHDIARSFIYCHQVVGLLLLLVLLASWQKPNHSSSSGITVYAFLNTECPISQQYVRRLADLHQEFGKSGVRFIALFPLRTDSPVVIERFRTEYKLPFAGLPDKKARLARQFRARVTPEVVVMQSDGRVVYQGAIDDWYVDLGKHRPQAAHAYLHNALDALLNGRPVTEAHTEAVGCLIE
ncbi:redoxin domain-containing protein [Spirosoma endbachense]|uniref:redoxin domain-containing protein n=1 Tax=Spirosoma endbachense TaxID=2666025 RepID=UPI001391CE73|nr:redoxin domain-containing protein [Spirosoma endbachense]